jgi:hypothetical protein
MSGQRQRRRPGRPRTKAELVGRAVEIGRVEPPKKGAVKRD